MPAAPFKVVLPQVHRFQVSQISGAQLGELVQQPPHRLPLAHLEVPRHVEGLKRPTLSILQEEPRPRHPVGSFAVDQVAHYIVDGPCGLALIAVGPGVGQVPQERVREAGVRERRAMVSERLGWVMVFNDSVSSKCDAVAAASDARATRQGSGNWS